MSYKSRVSDAVVRRLPMYYRHLRDLEKAGVVRISSQELGERMNVFYNGADELLWDGLTAEESQMLCLMLERMRRNLTKIVE